MPQRLALIAAAAVATIVLAVGLAAAGFGPVARPGEPALAAVDNAATTTTTETVPDPEVVYVKPAPSPKTVVVKEPATAAKPSKSSTTRTRVVRNVRRESDDRYEGRERDDDERGEREDD